MIIAISGTPGAGKTIVCNRLRDGIGKHKGTDSYNIIDLNDLIISEKLYTGTDDKRGSLIVDMERLKDAVRSVVGSDIEEECIITIIEGHLSHLLADCVIVLRCAPQQLKERLFEKGFNERKIQENLEAECLDVILIEAVEQSKLVYEINTTHKTVEQVGAEIEMIIHAIMSGDIEAISDYQPGMIDFSMDIEYTFEGWQQ